MNCVECGHNDVDREGYCKHETPHPKALYGNYPKRYCGHKCAFPVSTTEAGEGQDSNAQECPACGAHIVVGGNLMECAARCGWFIERSVGQDSNNAAQNSGGVGVESPRTALETCPFTMEQHHELCLGIMALCYPHVNADTQRAIKEGIESAMLLGFPVSTRNLKQGGPLFSGGRA